MEIKKMLQKMKRNSVDIQIDTENTEKLPIGCSKFAGQRPVIFRKSPHTYYLT